MSIYSPQNLQLPLQQRTLLITDVTKLQPFTAGGDSFRENIETLVSYNVRTDGLQQDCLYIKQGHLMTPTTFMTYSMAIDPRKTIVVTWTPIRNALYAAGLPALLSTGITLIYIILKVCRFTFYALSNKTKGRLAAATPGRCEQKHGSVRGKESHTEVFEQISGDNTAQHGTGTQRPSGSLPVSRKQQDLRLSSCGDVTEYSEEPPFRQNDQRLSSGRSTSPTNNYGKRPGCTHDDSTGVLTESGGWTNATNGQPSDDERTSGKEQPDKDFNDGVQRYRASKRQVSHVALQTDTCDTLYVTKNTLTAYTIAIVQNSQALQYEQMHAALQTARNEASPKTPIRAEELLTAHFNLAVLEDQKAPDINSNAQKSADTTQDAEPSASAPDDQTYVKIPSRYIDNSATRRPHPTGAVTPTCRREYGLVNTIPAGYESDDSWDNTSHNHEHTHTHNIVPLLTLCPWCNSPHRGCEQQQPRLNNNTNVRIGHAPYARPWDNQPYRRCTRSQQALRARAYRKIQRRYPIQ